MAATEYSAAPDVEKIAQPIINANHRHLKSVKIEYVFASKTPVTNGKSIWGKLIKISGVNAYLSGDVGDYFVMQISKPIWDELKPEKRKALVDHELCHGGVDAHGKLFIKPHDLEEFAEVVNRHGIWTTEVEKMAKAVQQFSLFTGDDSSETAATDAEHQPDAGTDIVEGQIVPISAAKGRGRKKAAAAGNMNGKASGKGEKDGAGLKGRTRGRKPRGHLALMPGSAVEQAPPPVAQ